MYDGCGCRAVGSGLPRLTRILERSNTVRITGVPGGMGSWRKVRSALFSYPPARARIKKKRTGKPNPKGTRKRKHAGQILILACTALNNPRGVTHRLTPTVLHPGRSLASRDKPGVHMSFPQFTPGAHGQRTLGTREDEPEALTDTGWLAWFRPQHGPPGAPMPDGCASGLTFTADTHAYPPTVVVLVESVGWTCGRDMTGVDQETGHPPSYR
ncbi:uncharacterized protein BO80DRAFT_278380 [Aspergillus ibericus CBS 121593]|uniref:Uncharacterized protein n=1 Tax=Aspergillus ibericus CBS 121593 TaxID=1448316 RepID=A0A395GJA4_9EURO|nr:hypothetical protein BO80DRAFT_278380 [Aspergillus ibericus CBS 121593]RAK95128.1 hypothetical protein BO80DRAFT_278380 [Aspergillus ibericus CBS 121593]